VISCRQETSFDFADHSRMSAASPASNTAESLPHPGAILGIDHGLKRIGIAICNVEQTIAVPVETWTVRSPQIDAQHFRKLVTDYRVLGLVVGLPLMSQTGDEGPQAKLTRKFGKWLGQETKLPVVFWDERYSSTHAETLLWSLGEKPGRIKGRLDGLAAQVILQTYLDRPSTHKGGHAST